MDKYIYEVLTKSKDYDYGEFGSNLWSALLLEYFREDKDSQVGIESIEHWAKHTSWGRRVSKNRAFSIEISENNFPNHACFYAVCILFIFCLCLDAKSL